MCLSTLVSLGITFVEGTVDACGEGSIHRRHWFLPDLCGFTTVALSQPTLHLVCGGELVINAWTAIWKWWNFTPAIRSHVLTWKPGLGRCLVYPERAHFQEKAAGRGVHCAFKVTHPPTVRKACPTQHLGRTRGLVPFTHWTSASGLFCGSGWHSLCLHAVPVTGVAVLDFAVWHPLSLWVVASQVGEEVLHEYIAFPGLPGWH